jgi:hypothetical protein
MPSPKRVLGVPLGWLAQVVSVPVYFVYAALVWLVNTRRDRVPLDPTVAAVMEPFFPDLDLTAVRIVHPARIPSAQPTTSGLTLGSVVYLQREPVPTNPGGMCLLLHELVHVDQGRRLGRVGFARRYGVGFATTLSYRDNPLEQEAFGFERNRRGDLLARLAAP